MHFARSIVLGYHSIPKINWESFLGRCEEKWGSFRGRFAIISGLGMISGLGSFRGLHRAWRRKGPGARFSKVPIINGPDKLSGLPLKIEVSIVLHLT